ncbi:hypothetical protein [Sporosarcina sp. G11-34]|uniref:UPF0738 family protein n=1 Tax=Sporosarcina sp. G11-34 TaxID=2849605 RepID=UPI0022A99361|nr:hypothetical protein [Sporosarcina sp. G11-34]MCZ2258984.1 hypothetical protein [Sporosarcina sp. G11-34]
MQTQLHIEKGMKNTEEIRFLLAKTPESLKGTPSGTMITDTDKITFVYLLEEEEGYRHIHFSEAVWPLMVDVLKTGVDPLLTWGEETLTLNGFNEELTMLIFNIEGNNNYGENFPLAVEKAFSEILTSTE